MDLSKLTQNEKLATYGAIAVVLAGLISAWGGLMFLAVLAGLALLVVVFLPQFSPQTSLPGSKGSLMAALGILAAVAALITMLQTIDFLSTFRFSAIMFLVALVGALLMAWAGWQELQSEGGKWQFGAAGTTPGATTAPPPQDAAPPAEAAADEPMSTTTTTEPAADAPSTRTGDADDTVDREERRTEP